MALLLLSCFIWSCFMLSSCFISPPEDCANAVIDAASRHMAIILLINFIHSPCEISDLPQTRGCRWDVSVGRKLHANRPETIFAKETRECQERLSKPTDRERSSGHSGCRGP